MEEQLGCRRLIERTWLLDFLVLFSGVELVAGFLINLIVPNFLNVIINIGMTMSTGSIDGEFHVESHSSLATLLSSHVSESLIKRGSFPSTSVGFSRVNTEHSLDFSSSGESLSNSVDLRFQILFFRDTSAVFVTYEAIGLHRWVHDRRAWSRVLIHSLFVIHLGVFVNLISLMKRVRLLGSIPFFNHVLEAGFNEIRCLNKRPSNADMARA